MAVRTSLLAAVEQGAGVNNKGLFLAPSGHTALLREISITNNDVAARLAVLYLQLGSGTAFAVWTGSLTAGAVTVISDRYLAIPDGWELLCYMPVAPTTSVTHVLSGADLLGVV